MQFHSMKTFGNAIKYVQGFYITLKNNITMKNNLKALINLDTYL